MTGPEVKLSVRALIRDKVGNTNGHYSWLTLRNTHRQDEVVTSLGADDEFIVDLNALESAIRALRAGGKQ